MIMNVSIISIITKIQVQAVSFCGSWICRQCLLFDLGPISSGLWKHRMGMMIRQEINNFWWNLHKPNMHFFSTVNLRKWSLSLSLTDSLVRYLLESLDRVIFPEMTGDKPSLILPSKIKTNKRFLFH